MDLMEKKEKGLLNESQFRLVLLVIITSFLLFLPSSHQKMVACRQQRSLNVGTLWINESMLYTSFGQAHDAWELLPRNSLAPFTAETQKILFSNQFPLNCSAARFFISHGHVGNGLGAQLHIATFHLGVALEENRVFLWSEAAGDVFTDTETCPSSSNFECFFRTPTSCSLHDARALGANTIEFSSLNEISGYSSNHVPSILRKLWLEGSRPVLQNRELKFWWRAQSVSFLARLNDRTTEAVRVLRTNFSAIVLRSTNSSSLLEPSINSSSLSKTIEVSRMAFPLMPGATSIHVRRSDKSAEMTLIPDKSYFAAAENLVLHNILGLSRTAFISSEDPATLLSAENEKQGWTMMWYDFPRSNNANMNPGFQYLSMPQGKLTRILLMQLLMTLECDAWVGTRASNWNR